MHTDGGDGQMESLGLSSWLKFTVVDEGDDVCFLLLSMFLQNYYPETQREYNIAEQKI